MTRIGIAAAEVWDHRGLLGDAVIIDAGQIVAVGRHEQLSQWPDVAWQSVAGGLITPGFVDAHVHLTSTGIALDGLNLADAQSAAELLEMLQAEAATQPEDHIIFGHGWDESRWRDATLPSRAQVDDAAGGRRVYLSRVDVHSALVSSSLLRTCGDEVQFGVDTARVSRQAHGALRTAALRSIFPEQRRDFQSKALAAAAAVGICTVHENGGPVVSSAGDLRDAIDAGRSPHSPKVVGYWGALNDINGAIDVGALGAAGDLFIDGSIGSRTAHLCDSYTDEATTGAAYVDASAIAEHISHSLSAGIQAGFHVIGDAAMLSIAEAIAAVVKGVGGLLPLASVRLEHAEMVPVQVEELLLENGVVLSMQPAFDAAWGGPAGMYAERLGQARASGMNRIRDHLDSGFCIGFGSDSPVTPMAPWHTLAAAVQHSRPEQRITVVEALAAHTRWAHALARQGGGELSPGQPADIAMWQVEAVSGSSLLESAVAAAAGGQPPVLVRSWRDGRVLAGAQ